LRQSAGSGALDQIAYERIKEMNTVAKVTAFTGITFLTVGLLTIGIGAMTNNHFLDLMGKAGFCFGFFLLAILATSYLFYTTCKSQDISNSDESDNKAVVSLA